MTAEKPYSAACERNREPILAVLRPHFADRLKVLEIGSGSGQHAVYFAAALPHLVWQSSDRAQYLPGIRIWLDEAALPNTPLPRVLDINGVWPTTKYDAVFSANTLHIMAWREVTRMFERLPQVLAADAKLAIYGPFRYGGVHSSSSNAGFDAALRQGGSASGIRDAEAVMALAAGIGFRLLEDCAMPANNRCLIWQRKTAQA